MLLLLFFQKNKNQSKSWSSAEMDQNLEWKLWFGLASLNPNQPTEIGNYGFLFFWQLDFFPAIVMTSLCL